MSRERERGIEKPKQNSVTNKNKGDGGKKVKLRKTTDAKQFLKIKCWS